MAFPDFLESPRFPDEIARYGSAAGPDWYTEVVRLGNRQEQRNARVARAPVRIELHTEKLSEQQKDQLLAWLWSVRGRAQGFRFRVPTDYRVGHSANVSGYIATAVAGQVEFMLQAQYRVLDSGGGVQAHFNRQILKPARRNEVQTICMGSPTGGHWHVTFGGNTTTDLAHNISGTNLTTALEALPSIGAGNVSASHPLAGVWVVTFQGDLGYQDVALMTADGSALTGPAWNPGQVVETTQGCHVALTVDGTPVVEGTDYTVDYTTGEIEFASAPGAGAVIMWRGEFDTPVRFDTDLALLAHSDFGVYDGAIIPLVELLAP